MKKEIYIETPPEILILLDREDTKGLPIVVRIAQTRDSLELLAIKRLKSTFQIAKRLVDLQNGQEDGENHNE